MKICLVGPTHPFRGGISHYTTLMYRHLRKRHEIIFVSFTRQYPKWLFPGKTDIDPSHAHINEAGVIKSLDSVNPLTWLKTVKIIIRFKPDLVIFPWWVSFWAPQFWTISSLIKQVTDAKVLFLCHNVVEHESEWLDKILTKLVLSKGDRFIVHSEEDKQNLLNIFPNALVRKTFHPIYDVFKSGHARSDIVLHRFKLENKVLLFFGFVREYKGLKYLLLAMPRILKKIKVHLLIVGEFWKDKNEYLSLIEELGIKPWVIIVDEYVPNEDVSNYFSAADLIVQPYISATGSGVIQTAYAFEKPVIATRVGCLPEVVEDGKTGYIVEPCQPDEIAEAVLDFFQNQDQKKMQADIQKHSNKFSWDCLINAVENTYQ